MCREALDRSLVAAARNEGIARKARFELSFSIFTYLRIDEVRPLKQARYLGESNSDYTRRLCSISAVSPSPNQALAR